MKEFKTLKETRAFAERIIEALNKEGLTFSSPKRTNTETYGVEFESNEYVSNIAVFDSHIMILKPNTVKSIWYKDYAGEDEIINDVFIFMQEVLNRGKCGTCPSTNL